METFAEKNCLGVLQKGNSHQNWEDLLEKIDSNDRNRRNVKTITAASVAIHLSWNSRDNEGQFTNINENTNDRKVGRGKWLLSTVVESEGHLTRRLSD